MIVAAPPDAATREHRSQFLTGVLAFVVTAMATMQTSSIALLPVLPDVFDTDVATVSWIMSATLIVGAVANPIVGRLGDIHGKRGPLIGCIACALAGSLLGATASGLGVVIAARALQGVGSGAIALAYGMVRDETPPNRLPAAVSVITAAGVSVGAGLGPVGMGFVVTAWGWRAVFLATAVWSAVGLCLVCSIRASTANRHPARFDWVGAGLLSSGLVLLLLGVSKGATWGWTSPRIALALIAGSTLLLLFWCWEARCAAPLVELSLLAGRGVAWANVGGAMVGFASFAQYIIAFTVVTASAGVGLGRSVAIAGLVQVPAAATLGVASLASSRLSQRIGVDWLLALGAAVIAVGFGALAVWHGSVVELSLVGCVVNLGLGAAFFALPLIVMENADASNVAAANAVNGLSRVVGSVVAAAVVTAIFASSTGGIADLSGPADWTFPASAAVAAAFAALVGCGVARSLRLQVRR